MGGCHVFVTGPQVVPHILPPVLPGAGASTASFGTGVAAAGALIGVAAAAYLTYAAVRKLSEDYQQANDELHRRQASQAAEREAVALSQQVAEVDSTMLAAQTQLQAAEEATVVFLHYQLQQLERRIAALPAPADELAAQCRALVAAVAEHPDALEQHFEAYRRVAEALAAQLALNKDLPKQSVLADQFVMLRAEIASPLLADRECDDVRGQLLGQLQALEALPERQVLVAAQGIDALSRRVHRELKALAERQHARLHASEEMRALVSESLAKIHAVSKQESFPEFAQQAHILLRQLTEALTEPSATNQEALRKIAASANTLFTTCEKAMNEAMTSAYISMQVSEALLALGYRVSQAEPEGAAGAQTLLAPVDDAHGLQVSIQSGGKVSAELVAFSEEHAHTDAETQAKVCPITQQLMKSLAEREMNVREKYRIHYQEGERLKVVKPPRQAEASEQVAKVRPKVLTAE